MKESRIERAVHRLMRAGRLAIHAQERFDFWSQFGTGSTRMHAAEARRDAAFADLDRAEVDAEEALDRVRMGDDK